jgi:biotin synthase
MNSMIESSPVVNTDLTSGCRWRSLAQEILNGHTLQFEEGLALLASPDDQLLDVLAAAYLLRHRHFGNTVQLYFLMNAKSGLCAEDCAYCSQSKVSQAAIQKYNFLNREKILEGAQAAAQRGSKTYCMVISARGPSEREMREVEALIPEIKSNYDLKVCTSLGLLTSEQARRLKACGVDRVNHNVNTSERFYAEICSTHTYKDRLDTLRAVREAELELCCGGIIGMGEKDEDVVHMALELQQLQVHSIPINFLNSIPGTPLQETHRLNARYCLKTLALFRFANPACELRIAGGRELHLGNMQCLGLYAANSLFVGDYLTTQGQPPEADMKMITEMGFEVTKT